MRGRWIWIALLPVLLLPSAFSAPAPKRIAFIVDSWYPRSHADVIGMRFLEGYRVGDRTYRSPLSVASVFADSPRPNDQTRALATKYGFRVAESIAEALLENPRSARPRLAVEGVLIATREDLPRSGQTQSSKPRVQVMREVLRVLDQAGARVPIFLDKMIAASWADSLAIVSEAAQRGVPLMAGSVLPYTPLDRPVGGGKVEVGIAVAAGPYWAYAFHAAEFLQGFMEQRGSRETGIASIREVGSGYWSLPDRERWGATLLSALLATARTRGRGTSAQGLGPESSVLLIQYADGTRAVLALLPRAFDEAEFLLGAQFSNGGTATGGLILQGEPFDHFGYLVHALAEFYTTGRPVVPVERALLTTGIVLYGQQARQSGPLSTPALTISYSVPRRTP
jgi:hypothetical protein